MTDHSKTSDCQRSVDLQGMQRSKKLYIVLLLLSQVIWVLTSSSGSFTLCESCGQADVKTFIQHARKRSGDYSDTSAQHREDSSATSEDEMTAQTSRFLSQLYTEEMSDLSSSPTVLSSEEYHHGSTTKQSPGTHQQSDLSSLCACGVELPTKQEEMYNDSDPSGRWHIPHSLPDLSGPCTINRITVSDSLSQREFESRFAFTEPVILTGLPEQSAFKAHTTKYRLLSDYGHDIITVATANTHSYHKERITLCKYIEKIMKTQTMESLGNETLYYFGDNNREGWSSLFSLYRLPPYHLPAMTPVLSFGLAGPGTGVPFHIHGPTFAETVYGRKRWFLYPPSHTPLFHPDQTTLHWLTHSYPHLMTKETEQPLECTLSPGEVIYFPDKWWHATLNLDTAVFMSTFYS